MKCLILTLVHCRLYNKILLLTLHHQVPVINQELFEISRSLQNNLSNCKDVQQFYNILEKFFLTYGVGKFGLNKAFRYENHQISPIIHIGNGRLDQLIGYESQKLKLTAKHRSFFSW